MDNDREYYHALRGKTKPRHLANTGDSTTTLKLHLEAAHCCSSNLTLDSGSVGHNIKSVVNFPELWKCRDHCHYSFLNKSASNPIATLAHKICYY